MPVKKYLNIFDYIEKQKRTYLLPHSELKRIARALQTSPENVEGELHRSGWSRQINHRGIEILAPQGRMERTSNPGSGHRPKAIRIRERKK